MRKKGKVGDDGTTPRINKEMSDLIVGIKFKKNR